MKIRALGAATFTYLVVFSITAWGLARGIAALRDWPWLAAADLRLPPWYWVLSGAAWALAGLTVGLMLWSQHPWARGALAVTALAFLGFWWVDHYALAAAAFFRHNWPFALAGSVLFLTAALAVSLWWNFFFGADHERAS